MKSFFIIHLLLGIGNGEWGIGHWEWGIGSEILPCLPFPLLPAPCPPAINVIVYFSELPVL
ncbi:hypothetical protein CV014_22860 [Nostoc sp. CMAA1605]|nr:hypothetical protein [Nostoc sp. CMAA1605]